MQKKFRSKFTEFLKNREKKHAENTKFHIAFNEKMKEFFEENNEFKRYTRHLKYSRVFFIIFNVLIWYLIFGYFGVKSMSIIFAVIISAAGIIELLYLGTLEKRVLTPITELIKGVDEIAKGNYEIKVDYTARNEVSILVNSFNDMAEKLHKAEILKIEYEANRKALVANISHDLKTPITSIQGYVEFIMKAENMPQDTLNKYHKTIYNNAAYVNKLIDDLFLFSKLDMEKLDFNYEKLNLKAFMDDVMQEFELELDSRNVVFHYENSLRDTYYFNIDRKRIYQVLKNIIGNAVKYGDKTDLKIIVNLYVEENNACVSIEDNGPGIPPDKLPHIFNRFYRVDYARTKDLISTGLGLAIAKELIEAQGGSINASSEENKGTCFTILIPIERSL
ncbi:sensor histidine kinase [Clostridium akagii]|uniref:sensor histidine kinase n=1 Tax=Clostridium akagii TaxID=91623 RepID=UPI00055AA5D0|nr:HAMP domain-containing sensor histidine kinase [Clostridium akagii]